MIILLSPAKKLNLKPTRIIATSTPTLLKHSDILLRIIKQRKAPWLAKLMSISPELAQLNYQRYQNLTIPFSADDTLPAITMFAGAAYDGLDIKTFNETEVVLLNEKLRILSGFYGLLKPLDQIMPYRLEMGTRLKTRRGENLYQFWGNIITDQLNCELADTHNMSSEIGGEMGNNPTVINLASNEYFKAIKPKLLNANIITPTFKEYKYGSFKALMQFVKIARGKLTRYIIKNNITNIDDIKNYTADGYSFNTSLSSNTDWTFTRK